MRKATVELRENNHDTLPTFFCDFLEIVFVKCRKKISAEYNLYPYVQVL